MRFRGKDRAGRSPRFPFRVLSRILPVLGVLGSAPALHGCSLGYLLHLGSGEMKILCSRVPVEKILRDEGVPEREKEKIRLVLEAKAFGERELGLAPSKNYTVYYRVEGGVVAWNLTASPRFALEPYRWCFPVVGCLPYKGFFGRARALRARDRMERKGFDTYLRPVAAYSTLGWFKDPIFSPMLRYPEPVLVEIVLHEMVHGTIFVRGQGDFNEGVATFVGEKGAEAFFRARGRDAAGFLEAIASRRRQEALFQETMQETAERLRALYASGLDPSAMEAGKREIFRREKTVLAERLEAAGGTGWRGILDVEWNNAFVVSWLTYHEDPALWEALYDRFGGDLKALVTWLREMDCPGDRYACIRRRLGLRSPAAPVREGEPLAAEN